MTNYRLTFEVLTSSVISNRELQDIHAEMEKYLRTVLIPTGSKLESQNGAQVTKALEEIPYAIHKHNGGDRCGGCREQSEDGRS